MRSSLLMLAVHLRLAARDADGLRWLDAHKEAGQSLELHLPATLAGHLEIERLSPAGAVEARYPLPESATAPVALASLSSEPPQNASRGGHEIFRGLFVRPFGPQALAAYQEEMAKPGADQARIAAAIEERLVRIQAEEHRRRKWALIAGYIASGMAAGFVAVNEVSSDQTREYRLLERGFLLGVTGLLLGVTLKGQFSTSPTDKLIELWRKDPHHASLDVTATPTSGGGMVGLSGKF